MEEGMEPKAKTTTEEGVEPKAKIKTEEGVEPKEKTKTEDCVVEPKEKTKSEKGVELKATTKADTTTRKATTKANTKTRKAKTTAVTSTRTGMKDFNKSNFKKAEIGKLRQNVNNLLRYSNATLFEVYKEQFVCAYCTETFDKPAALRAHTEDKHTQDKLNHKYMTGQRDRFYAKLDGTNIKCSLCLRTIESLPVLQNFMEHLITDHSIHMYTDAPYTTKIRLFNFDTDKWKCPICTTEFRSFLTLNKHMHSRHTEFYCDICRAGYSSERALASHRFVHQTGEFKCDICEAVFEKRSQQYRHKLHAHDTKGPRKPHKCKECEERFAQFTDLKSHMLETHDKEFQNEEQCNACSLRFANQKDMMMHVRRVHLMERSQKCDICGRCFFDKRALKNHAATHTGIKEFQCDVCQRRFTRKVHMKEHMRIHVGDRRYACRHCDKTFVQRGSFTRHVKTKHNDYYFQTVP